MALVNTLKEGFKERTSLHEKSDATFYVLEFPNGKVLQIDSYGRNTRKIPGKVSQSMQFSPKAIKELKEILKKF